jgi:hypothetical protein
LARAIAKYIYKDAWSGLRFVAAEKVECACKLLGVQVNKTEGVRNDPLERVKVQRAFQACNNGEMHGFRQEAHANVVPEMSRVGAMHDGDMVFHKRNVQVRVVLKHTSNSENGLHVERIVRERIGQVTERSI